MVLGGEVTAARCAMASTRPSAVRDLLAAGRMVDLLVVGLAAGSTSGMPARISFLKLLNGHMCYSDFVFHDFDHLALAHVRLGGQRLGLGHQLIGRGTVLKPGGV